MSQKVGEIMKAWSLTNDGPLSFITLNRPPINTLDRFDLEELAEVMEGIEHNKQCRVVVITGGIEGIFCCGGDLKYWRNIHDAGEVSRSGSDVFASIERSAKPVIAVINGHVVGDGLALALSCDIRIASEAATFRLPEVGCGFIPGWGTIRMLVAAVGHAHASDLLLTCRTVKAGEARMMGLVNEVVSTDLLRDRTNAKAQELARLSPSALRAAKLALRGHDETECFKTVWGGEDWQTGIDAVVHKKVPIFS
jgi:enoyl-CoA hydratase